MKIDKKDVQCICYFNEPHHVHKVWMQAASSRKILPYIPKSLMWMKKIPIINQILPFIYGFFLPSAKVYFVEGAAMVPAVFFKKGVVISINSDTFFYNMRKSGLVKLYSKLLLKRIDGFISTSTMMHEDATKMGKKPSEIAYPFMDNTNLFKIHPKFNNDNICLIAGTRYSKGIDILLNVFEQYRKIKPNAKLFVLGNEQEWVLKIKEAGGITPGYVDPYKYLEQSSIYVNPARHEPFGVNILEAMAAGVPPLISENCGAKDIVEKIDSHLIVPLSVDKIIERMMWLKSNKERYMKLSKKCKEISKKFTKNRSEKEFEEKFMKLLERV